MNIIGLDGKRYSWNLSKYVGSARNSVSEPHKKARELIKELYPFDPILEEVALPGSGKNTLYADFYINRHSLMIEVHGQQHFEYNTFFHKTKRDFYLAQARDRRKKEWCELNDIILVVLDDKESEDEWRDKIKNI